MPSYKPTVIDLFAGAGGFSKGFYDAGFHVNLAIEIDAWACKTFKYNFPSTNVLEADVKNIKTSRIKELVREKPDVIIGGPPCQGFSISGPPKKDPKDPRNSLFVEFVRFINELQPKALIMENVKGLLSRKTEAGERVIKIIESALSDCGYYIKTVLLNSCNYGVPQHRERVFIIGTMEKCKTSLLPPATHRGYKWERDYDLKYWFVENEHVFKPYTTLWEATSDLPQIPAGVCQAKYSYPLPPQNEYQELMRKGSSGVYNHVPMKHSKRVIERFKQIRWGESVSDVPEKYGQRKRGNPLVFSKKAYDQNNRRLHPNLLSHTITASFYANFVHPYLDRNFTAREAARLQSFPDTFIFKGKKTVPSFKLLAREGRFSEMHLCQYAQIGNAVPPLLAEALAKHLRNLLDL